MNGATYTFLAIAAAFLCWHEYRSRHRWKSLTETLRQIASGHLNAPVPRHNSRAHSKAAGYIDEIKEQLIHLQNQHTAEISHLRGILDSMTEGVMVVDAQGKIRLANEQLRRLFGLNEAPLGKSLMEALRSHKIHEIFMKASSSGKVLGEEIVVNQGQEQFFELNALKLLGNKNESKGVVFVFHEITRIRRLENVRKEFVTNASHELRTPLSIIKGYVETLADGAVDDPKTARKFVGIMHKHTERLAELIEDMLELSRLESGRLDIRIENVDARALLLRLIQSFQTLTDRKKIRIFSEINPAEIRWRMDSRLVERVIFNLMDNAIKYSPPESEIRIKMALQDNEFFFSITDNGQGVPKESIPHLFERFYRVDKARSNELGGTGLGLSIAKHIVQNHGGNIWVQSVYGKGATFSFTIPAP